MHHSRNDEPIDVAENFLERLAVFRRFGWKIAKYRPGTLVRRDADVFEVLAKIRDPVCQFVQLLSKFLWGGVPSFAGTPLCRSDASCMFVLINTVL